MAKGKGILQQLAIEELEFCCMYSFINSAQHHSARKVARALGVSRAAVRYWSDRVYSGKLMPCSSCRLVSIPLPLRQTTSGRIYVPRDQLRQMHDYVRSFPLI